MVTTSTNAIGVVTGQTGAPQMGEAAASGQDDSEFAQLLGGMGGAAETAVVANAKPAKAALNTTDTVASDAAGLSAEMLALCGVPMAAPTPMPIPALIAAGAGGQQATTGSSASAKAAMIGSATISASASNLATQAAMNLSKPVTDSTDTAAAKPNAVVGTELSGATSLNQPAPTAVDSIAATDASANNFGTTKPTPSGVVTPQDMQWLRTGNQLTNAANAMKQDSDLKLGVKNSDALATTAATTDATLLPDGTNVQSDGQGAYQQLAAQMAPMVAMSIGQRHERESDAAGTDTSSAPMDAMAMNTQPAQPAGTQLATDAPTIDNFPRHQLHAAMGSHQWATELGNKLTMLASKDTQSATLYMTPADLGPVQVRIDLHQDQASVWFSAEHADTRSALEQSLPRLRELFTAQGMSLTDAGVFGDRSKQQSSYSDANSGVFAGTHFATEESAEDTSLVRSISLSMLDAYA